MNIDIQSLIITQEGLRNMEALPEMIEFAKNGGIFTQDEINNHPNAVPGFFPQRLIQLSKFEDGRIYVADGHHRILSILLSGERDFICDTEFELIPWKYSGYNSINIENGWFTPFDPRKEVRLSDMWFFRSLIDNHRRADAHDYDIIKFIVNNEEIFKHQRTISTFEQLAKLIETKAG